MGIAWFLSSCSSQQKSILLHTRQFATLGGISGRKALHPLPSLLMENGIPQPVPTPTGLKRPSKKLLVIIVIALLILVGVLEMKRRMVEEQLQQLTIRLEQLQTGNTRQNREQAQRIIRKVKRLMVINEDVEPTVATIVDVEALRERNPFYSKAENGDFLVVTPERAILYSEDRNIILDVIPVQIQAPPAQPPALPAEGEE